MKRPHILTTRPGGARPPAIRAALRTLRLLLAWLPVVWLPAGAGAQPLPPPLPQPPFHWQDFDAARGYTTLKIDGRRLDSAGVGAFHDVPGKGAVRQHFGNVLLSGQPRTYPFAYQYEVRTSPDGRRHLACRYEYARPQLAASCVLLDARYMPERRFELPVDDGTTAHGFWPDNAGAVYGVATGPGDAVYVTRHLPAGGTTEWLQLGPDATRRNRFAVAFAADGVLLLAHVAEDAAGNWRGAAVTTFDFAQGAVTDVAYYAADEAARREAASLPGGRMEIVDFKVAGGQKTLVLQAAAIQANRYVYDPFAVLDPAGWAVRKQQAAYGRRFTIRL